MPDAAPVVRAATPADADAVHELARGLAITFTVDAEAFHRTYADLTRLPGAHLLVADTDGRVGGYLLGFTRPTFYANGPVGWVEEVAVRAELRRRGVGGALVVEFERRATAGGCRVVALATTRADDFYRALGYDDHATYFRKLL